MKCKRKCYWNCDGYCCPECGEDLDKVNGNDDCPIWLRKDFEDYFFSVYEGIYISIRNMGIEELEKVKEFISKLE